MILLINIKSTFTAEEQEVILFALDDDSCNGS